MNRLTTLSCVTVCAVLVPLLLPGYNARAAEIGAPDAGPGAIDHSHADPPARQEVEDDGRGTVPDDIFELVAEELSERAVRTTSGTFWGDETVVEMFLQIAQHASDSLNEALMMTNQSRITAHSTKDGLCPIVVGIQEYRYPVRYARLLPVEGKFVHSAPPLLKNVHFYLEPSGHDSWPRHGQARLGARIIATIGWNFHLTYASAPGWDVLAEGTLADDCDCLQSDDWRNAVAEPHGRVGGPLQEQRRHDLDPATDVQLVPEGYEHSVVTESLERRHGTALISLVREHEDVAWQDLAVRVDRLRCEDSDTRAAIVALWAIVHADGVAIAFDIPLLHLTACRGPNVDSIRKRAESLNYWAQERRGAAIESDSYILPFTVPGDLKHGLDRQFALQQVTLPNDLSDGLSVLVMEDAEENVRVYVESGSGQRYPLIVVDGAATDSKPTSGKQ